MLPRKKSDYARDEAIKEQLKTVVDFVREHFDDWKERSVNALIKRSGRCYANNSSENPNNFKYCRVLQY